MEIIRVAYLAILVILGGVFEEGASISVETFLIPSILMGLGVAIDVALATLAKFQDYSLSWKNWTFPVTLTHTFFPAFGYFLFWSLDEALPALHALLGITGFILVAAFVYEVLCESVGTKPKFGISAWIGEKIGLAEGDARTFVAVLAVSWDALWSGPAKAAQAAAGDWSGFEVVLSFIIAGVVVALIAEAALTLTRYLRKQNFENSHALGNYIVLGKYFELSVIGGFGVLALWNAFSPAADLYASISIAAILLLFFFIAKFKLLKQNA